IRHFDSSFGISLHSAHLLLPKLCSTYNRERTASAETLLKKLPGKQELRGSPAQIYSEITYFCRTSAQISIEKGHFCRTAARQTVEKDLRPPKLYSSTDSNFLTPSPLIV